jgi:hypothetical protein
MTFMKEIRQTIVSNKIICRNNVLVNVLFLACGHESSTCQDFDYPKARGKLNNDTVCYTCMVEYSRFYNV